MGHFNDNKWGNRSQVQGFHSRPWTAFGMPIYEKNLSFVRPNLKFGAELAVIW